jgi:hypothetical protein
MPQVLEILDFPGVPFSDPHYRNTKSQAIEAAQHFIRVGSMIEPQHADSCFSKGKQFHPF